MKGLIPTIKTFLKRNSSTILTCIGAAGVVATAVAAVKATPKARLLLDSAEESKGKKLTVTEKVKIAGPAYIPSALIGVSTIACIFGANVLNKKQQAGLTSAYALLSTSYNEYRGKVKEVLGDEADEKVINAVTELHYKDSDALPHAEGKQRFFDFFSLMPFESTMEEVEQAERHVNNIFKLRGYVTLGEFYEALGLQPADCDYDMGWSATVGNYLYGYDEIVFYHYRNVMDDGQECFTIVMPYEPTSDFLM